MLLHGRKQRLAIVGIFVSAVIVSIFIFVFFTDDSYSYDTTVAHPNIVELAARLYNSQNFTQKLTEQEISWLKQGAKDEDIPTRWLNHFYDPIYNYGLTFGRIWDSAKDWAQNFNEQKNFALGDQSWQRALADFKKNDEEIAFKELGHTLHLLADMTVPAHTRDQVHASPPDSYEQFIKNNWDNIIKKVSYNYTNVNSLNSAFDTLANYSNNNFYSDETIESGKYRIIPNLSTEYIDYNGGSYEFFDSKDENKINYKLYFNGSPFSWQDILYGRNIQKNFSVKHDLILTSYAQHLLPKAIGYSAGTIKLFFDEANKQGSNNNQLSDSRINGWGMLNGLVGSVVQLVEDVKNYYDNEFGGDTAMTAPAPIMSQDSDNNTQANQTTLPQPTITTSPNHNLPTGQAGITISPQPVDEEIDDQIPNFNNPTPMSGTTHDSDNNTQTNDTSSTAQTSSTMQGGLGWGVADNSMSQNSDSSNQTTTTTTTTTTSTNQTPNPNNQTPTTTTSTDQTPNTDSQTSTTTSSTTDFITTTTSTIPDTFISSTTSTTDTTTTTTSTADTTTTAPTPIMPVVINEIAWAGVGPFHGIWGDCRNGEWLELYNNTSETIELTGWKLLVDDHSIALSGSIPAKGYYLLERGYSDSPGLYSPVPDLVYSSGYGLPDNGANLLLTDASGTMIDQVDASSSWFAGSTANQEYRTMARIDSTKSGNLANNWQTTDHKNYGVSSNYCSTVFGSPKITNTGYVLLAGEQTADNFVLSKKNNPYILTNYQIPAGKTLTIEPGVIIKGQSPSVMVIYGTLLANGTAEEPIIFTSNKDNPAPGDWVGLHFYLGAVGNFNYAKISYAGYLTSDLSGGFWTPRVNQPIQANQATVNFYNSEFNNNLGTLLYLISSSSTIDQTIFNGGTQALYVKDTKLKLSNSSFNNFSDSKGPVYIWNTWPEISNLSFSGNTVNKVYFDIVAIDGEIIVNTDLAQTANFSVVIVNPAATLSLDPGVQMNFLAKGGINVNGILQSNGTAAAPVLIKPANSGTNWGSIVFNNSSSSLQYTNLEEGNANGLAPDASGMIIANNSTLQMDHVNLSNPYRPGNTLNLTNSQVTLNNSQINDTQKFESLWIPSYGIKVQGGDLTLTNNQFSNIQIGIVADNSALLQVYSMVTSSFSNVDNLINWNGWTGFGQL